MDKYFEILETATAKDVSLPRVRRIPYDPLFELTNKLEEMMRKSEKDFETSTILCAKQNIADLNDDFMFDSRLRYANLLNFLLNKIAQFVEMENSTISNSSLILSVKKINILHCGLEFFIATGVLPYLDEGNGKPIELRSKMIKCWKSLSDHPLRIQKLLSAAEIIFRLGYACDSLRMLIVNQFLRDFIAINEQLMNLKEKSFAKCYEEFISKDINKVTVMGSLISMVRDYKLENKYIYVPKWLKYSLSDRLSRMLVDENGLNHLITTLIEGNPSLLEDFTFVRSLARTVLRKPNGMNGYYAIVFEQFIDLLQHHPLSNRLSVCFALTIDTAMKIVPSVVRKNIFDVLLQPWELLMSNIIEKSTSDNMWTDQLDKSLVVLSVYLDNLPPEIVFEESDRLKSIFPALLMVYGKTKNILNTHNIENKENLVLFSNSLHTILRYVLSEKMFTVYSDKAKFIVENVIIGYQPLGYFTVRVKPRKLIVELNDDLPSATSRKQKFDFIMLKYNEENLKTNEKSHSLDVLIDGIFEFILEENKSKTSPILIDLLTECINYWRMDSMLDEADDNMRSRFVSSSFSFYNEALSNEVSKMRTQYFMGRLNEILSYEDLHSTDNLISAAKFAETVLQSTVIKLELLCNVNCTIVSQNGSEIAETETKSLVIALAMVGAIIAASIEKPELKKSLSKISQELGRFCDLLCDNKLVAKSYGLEEALESANELTEYLKVMGIDCLSKKEFKKCSIVKKVEDYNEISKNMNDSLEAVRGHAFIALTKAVRQRIPFILEAVKNDEDIMNSIMKGVADDDSYVYLSAISAMAELAYWRQDYFRIMVEFFLDPRGSLKGLIDMSDHNFDESEELTYILVQRVKVGEALGKVCRALGEMAPHYYDRLCDQLLTMITNIDDQHLKASTVMTLADLVTSCRGRKVEKNINEFLSIIERLLSLSGSHEVLRRSAVVLLRSFIVTYDKSLLEGLGYHLRDINRTLRLLTTRDKDSTVRLLASLCLDDIEYQIGESIGEITKKYVHKIRI